jgi:hypothetical protein
MTKLQAEKNNASIWVHTQFKNSLKVVLHLRQVYDIDMLDKWRSIYVYETLVYQTSCVNDK